MIEYGTHRHPTAVANEAQLFFGGGMGGRLEREMGWKEDKQM